MPRRHPLDDPRPEDDVTARPANEPDGSASDAAGTPPPAAPSSGTPPAGAASPGGPPSSGAAPNTPPPPAPGPAEEPLGLRGQIGATKDAALGIVRAHVDLAKAEASEIADEVKRAAALGCLAAGGIMFIGLLLPIGLTLFFGEWLFGSMGWGVLLGTLFWIGIAITAVLVALRVTGVQWSLAAALVIATVLAILFAFRVPHEAWRRLGDAVGLDLGAATPVVVGLVVIGLVGAIVGLIAGSSRSGSAAAGAMVAGAILGIALGAFSAINFDRKGGAASGIAIGLAIWSMLMAIRLARSGIDTDDLKKRFWPDETIETAKETMQWVRERTPLGPKS